MGVITLQFVATDGLLSSAIRAFERGWCSHVDPVTDDGRLLGAQVKGGVQIGPPDYEKFTRVERVVIAVPDHKEAGCYSFIKVQVGRPYDELAIDAFAFDRDVRTPDAWFCDELVAAGPEHAEVLRKLAPQVNRLDVRDLYLVVSAIAPVQG